jgi:hypothetical protein
MNNFHSVDFPFNENTQSPEDGLSFGTNPPYSGFAIDGPYRLQDLEPFNPYSGSFGEISQPPTFGQDGQMTFHHGSYSAGLNQTASFGRHPMTLVQAGNGTIDPHQLERIPDYELFPSASFGAQVHPDLEVSGELASPPVADLPTHQDFSRVGGFVDGRPFLLGSSLAEQLQPTVSLSFF